MTTDRRLYLVSSQPGAAAKPVHARRTHLRLVEVEREPEAPPVSLARPVTARPLTRPLGQRMMQVASDAAVFAVALLVGLRPNA